MKQLRVNTVAELHVCKIIVVRCGAAVSIVHITVVPNTLVSKLKARGLKKQKKSETGYRPGPRVRPATA